MAAVRVGEAVASGFNLIGRKPLTVGIWGLVQFLYVGAMFALYIPFYITLISRVGRAAASGNTAAPDPAMMGMMMQMQGLSLVISLFGMVVSAVVYCAAFRAILHPERDRYAYLRLGKAELFIGILMIAAYFAFVIGAVVAMIPIAIIIGILAAMKAAVAAAVFGVLAVVAATVAALYLALRFSMIGPMIVDSDEIRVAESWAVTRGKVGSLFLLGLSLFMILMAAETVLLILAGVLGFSVLGMLAGGVQRLPAFFQGPPQQVAGKMAPLFVVLAVFWIPLSGFATAVFISPWAKVYRDLTQGDLATTFA